MTGLMETVESRRQAFHEFPQPLGNPAKRRAGFPHSHSSDERRKSGKPKAGFPLSRLRFLRAEGAQKQNEKRPGGPGCRPPAASEAAPSTVARATERRLLQQNRFRIMSIGNKTSLSGSFLDWNMLCQLVALVVPDEPRFGAFDMRDRTPPLRRRTIRPGAP